MQTWGKKVEMNGCYYSTGVLAVSLLSISKLRDVILVAVGSSVLAVFHPA
jgi:hypothetical protein